MYAFAQRSDTECKDEPLYAHHLTQCPAIFRPYREELMRAQEADGAKVLAELAHRKVKVLYAKHMAKHRVALAPELYTSNFVNAILIRDPRRLASSFHKKVHGWHCMLCLLSRRQSHWSQHYRIRTCWR